MTSINDRVKAKEQDVDAGITKVQKLLEEIKTSPHSAWIVLAIGVVFLISGLVIWLI